MFILFVLHLFAVYFAFISKIKDKNKKLILAREIN